MGIGEETVITARAGEDNEPIGEATPGLLAVFCGGEPILRAERYVDGAVEIGRSSFGGALAKDSRVSRRHVRIEQKAAGFAVTDFGSTNGTSVDGDAIAGTVERDARVIRIGRSLLVPVRDVTLFEGATVEDSARGIAGPTLRAAWLQIALIAARGEAMFIRGESGAGKELAARLFHEQGATKDGPFVAVNCATIPALIAERLLFGAKKGAYSGADADSEGYVQAAHQGTLFLDEIADLDLAVQAKLLRVVETKEVFPLGASKGKKVTVRIVTATHRDLRASVADKRFREDLYFRIGRPEVSLPPLRARPEEIPWHLARATRAVDPAMTVDVSLVEEALWRAGPGNVRELAPEARLAAERARAEGKTAVTKMHLGQSAGLPIAPASSAPASGAPMGERGTAYAKALDEAKGNVSKAAQILGVHRNRVRRWLEKNKR